MLKKENNIKYILKLHMWEIGFKKGHFLQTSLIKLFLISTAT